MTFILASASPRRKVLLEQIGVVPDKIIPANIQESPRRNETPSVYVKRVAQEKATTVAALHPGCTILAADTEVVARRKIFGKAHNDEDVRQYLRLLSGRRHQVLTALCIITASAHTRLRLVKTIVTFKSLSESDIQTYLTTKEGLGKAGGYGIQGFAESFIKQINGSYSNIVGLPLYETRNLLTGLT